MTTAASAQLACIVPVQVINVALARLRTCYYVLEVTYMYNIAFETTPDSDATVQMEMENDEVPLESYMDYTFRMK